VTGKKSTAVPWSRTPLFEPPMHRGDRLPRRLGKRLRVDARIDKLLKESGID
jgi:hypothetical protein